MKDKYINKILVILGYFILCGLCVTVCYLNFAKIVNNMDTDYIAELNYGRLMWTKKSILPTSWFNANELMFFRPTLLYALIYGVTNKYVLSASIALTFSFFMVIGSFVFWCRSVNMKNHYIMIGLIFLLSCCGNGRSFVVVTCLFYGYYSFYLCVVLLTLGVLEREKHLKKVNKWLLLSVNCFAILLGVVGIRMSMFLYVPILIYCIFCACFDQECINKKVYKLGIVLFFCNILGLILGKIFLTDVFVASDVLNNSIVNFREIPSKLWENICAVLMMILGTNGEMDMFSQRAIDCLVKGVLLAVLLICCVMERKKIRSSFSMGFYLCYFVVILGITTLTGVGTGVPFYYFLLPCMMAYLIQLLLEKLHNDKGQWMLILLIYIIAGSNYGLYYNGFLHSEKSETVETLVSYLMEEQISDVCMSFWEAGPVEAYSDGKISVAYMPGQPQDIEVYQWLCDSEKYESSKVVILTDTEEQSLRENQSSKLNLWSNVKIAEIGSYNIYQFSVNTMRIITMPQIGSIEEYKPVYSVLLGNSYVAETGEVTSNGEDGFFITGPYINVEEGTYTVEFECEVLQCGTENESAGFVDVAAFSGTEQIAVCSIPSSGVHTLVMENVELSNKSNVEFRCCAYAGSSIKIHNIRITRIR